MKSRVLLAAALALALASCAKKHPAAPIVEAPAVPVASSPSGAVQRLAWAVNAHEVPAYMALLTDDYAFVFASSDTAGNGFPGRSLNRDLEGEVMHHMLVGGGSYPPASLVQLTIDSLLVVRADSRQDPRDLYAARVTGSIRTTVHMQVYSGTGDTTNVTSITGYALLYLVRGDAAYFLPERDAARDSTLWYVSRWEDETAGTWGAPGLHSDPTQQASLGDVKVRYLYSARPALARR
jgi:hypothetical protein